MPLSLHLPKTGHPSVTQCPASTKVCYAVPGPLQQPSTRALYCVVQRSTQHLVPTQPTLRAATMVTLSRHSGQQIQRAVGTTGSRHIRHSRQPLRTHRPQVQPLQIRHLAPTHQKQICLQLPQDQDCLVPLIQGNLSLHLPSVHLTQLSHATSALPMHLSAEEPSCFRSTEPQLHTCPLSLRAIQACQHKQGVRAANTRSPLAWWCAKHARSASAAEWTCTAAVQKPAAAAVAERKESVWHFLSPSLSCLSHAQACASCTSTLVYLHAHAYKYTSFHTQRAHGDSIAIP